MFKGYKISINQFSLPFNHRDTRTDYLSLFMRGLENFKESKKSIRSALSSYIRPDGRIDGSAMMSDWFPAVSSHVFLSHSSADKKLAIAFSQWLFENFKIKAFIDSTVWGYADNLLEIIDDTFAWRPDKNDYNYDLRNRTTAFVHNLLSASLSNMIDKCECLMFLNSPNSIIPDPYREETASPWIFYELQQSAVIRKHKERTRYFSDSTILAEARDFKVSLPAKTDYLTRLNGQNLLDWRDIASLKGTWGHPQKSLDLLYKLTE